MIAPAFAWFAVTFMAGAVLLVLRRLWTIALAFVLAVSPPFLVFAGYNLLAGAGGGGSVGAAAGGPAPGPHLDAAAGRSRAAGRVSAATDEGARADRLPPVHFRPAHDSTDDRRRDPAVKGRAVDSSR